MDKHHLSLLDALLKNLGCRPEVPVTFSASVPVRPIARGYSHNEAIIFQRILISKSIISKSVFCAKLEELHGLQDREVRRFVQEQMADAVAEINNRFTLHSGTDRLRLCLSRARIARRIDPEDCIVAALSCTFSSEAEPSTKPAPEIIPDLNTVKGAPAFKPATKGRVGSPAVRPEKIVLTPQYLTEKCFRGTFEAFLSPQERLKFVLYGVQTDSINLVPKAVEMWSCLPSSPTSGKSIFTLLRTFLVLGRWQSWTLVPRSFKTRIENTKYRQPSSVARGGWQGESAVTESRRSVTLVQVWKHGPDMESESAQSNRNIQVSTRQEPIGADEVRVECPHKTKAWRAIPARAGLHHIHECVDTECRATRRDVREVRAHIFRAAASPECSEQSGRCLKSGPEVNDKGGERWDGTQDGNESGRLPAAMDYELVQLAGRALEAVAEAGAHWPVRYPLWGVTQYQKSELAPTLMRRRLGSNRRCVLKEESDPSSFPHAITASPRAGMNGTRGISKFQCAQKGEAPCDCQLETSTYGGRNSMMQTQAQGVPADRVRNKQVNASIETPATDFIGLPGQELWMTREKGIRELRPSIVGRYGQAAKELVPLVRQSPGEDLAENLGGYPSHNRQYLGAVFDTSLHILQLPDPLFSGSAEIRDFRA
ncbi:hypothetical protein C8R47DRAFT_1189481 [Mycena vitilis]|nr:hypothetical protein C8R47DRAFT_1189481 [Mycena vitilis]